VKDYKVRQQANQMVPKCNSTKAAFRASKGKTIEDYTPGNSAYLNCAEGVKVTNKFETERQLRLNLSWSWKQKIFSS
jgi:hypothetical protein